MIIETTLNNNLIMHKSDNNVMLLQVETNKKYASAIDTLPCKYTYIETEEPIPAPPDIHISDKEFFDIIKEVL